jgi:hypothetical protein
MKHLLQQWNLRGTPSRKTGRTPQWTVFLYSENRVNLSKSSGMEANNIWECNCPAWCKNSPRSDCKHILQIKLTMAQAGVDTGPVRGVSGPFAEPTQPLPKRRIRR